MTNRTDTEVRFMFGRQPARTAWSLAASALFDVLIVGLFVLLGRLAHHSPPVPVAEALNERIVWIAEKGPGGGGGGGGNQMPLPPKPAELRGKEKITIPAVPRQPAPLQPSPPAMREPDPVPVTIPALELASAIQDLPGVIAAPGPLSASQGAGRNGGAGTGSDGGIGPGQGTGLGRGSGGNTGGDVYQPGNGVKSPVPIATPKPSYTAEAMRARIQGTARIRCVVQPTGVCTNIVIEHSLDPAFGLDQEAVKSVGLWRFQPALRLGQPVPMQVTIDVEFALR